MANWDPARTVLIANPAARGGALGRQLSQMTPLLRRHLGDIRIIPTTLHAQGAETAAAIVEDDPRVNTILVAGGDGTISTVCAGVLDSLGKGARNIRIGLVPMGTGGDFRRMLNGGARLPLEERIARLPEALDDAIDVGRLSYPGSGARRMMWMINSLNFGFGGFVGEQVNKGSKRWGSKISFLTPILRYGPGYPPAMLRFTPDDGGPIYVRTKNAFAGNGAFCAGSARPTPGAILDDGLLDVTIPVAYPILAELKMLAKLYTRGLYGAPGVRAFRTKSLLIESLDRREPIDVDGEHAGPLPMRVEMVPRAIRFLDLDEQFLQRGRR